MGSAIRIAVATAVLCCLSVAPASAAMWTQLRSANFLFIGDASERDIRRIARKLEQFREVMSAVLPSAVTSSVPTVVVVFSTDRVFTPFKPQYNGEAIENLGGYFVQGLDVNYIAMNAEAGEEAYRTVFHEFSHFMIANTAGKVPVWADEGLAGFYETYEERDGGKAAVIGTPPKDYLRMLQGRIMMPLAELMAVDSSSPAYNEGDRRGLFYAQSWALTHYLTFGNRQRDGQFKNYLRLLGHGSPLEQAFREAFMADSTVMDRELRDYVKRFAFIVMRFNFTDKPGDIDIERGDDIDEPEAQGYLGDMLARVNAEAGRDYLKKLVAADKPAPRALYGLGALELRSDHAADALPLLERAAVAAPRDGAVQAALGRALIERLQAEAGKTAEDRAVILNRARTALSRAVELEPLVPASHALLGYVEHVSGSDMARAVREYEQAVRLAPTREQYRLMLAEGLIVQRDFEKASTYLGPLMARSTDASVRTSARALLARIAEERNRELSPSAAPRATLPPALAPPGAAPSSVASGGSSSRTPAMILDLRALKDGETREPGLFRSVDCRTGGIVLTIARDSGPLRVAAKAFTDIEFITYRSNSGGSVACGTLEMPVRVLVTYRPNSPGSGTPSETDGVAVAIELVPDNYVVR